MKIFCFAALAAVFALSCASPPADNVSTVPTVTPTPAGSVAWQSEPAKPTPQDEAEMLKADFDGTVGATEKKNKIREVALLTGVRTGRHDGFDRIVFEFRGAEMPGYHIEYIDKPVRACGSGDVVPLQGDAWLQIRFEPANAHTEAGKPTLAFRELTPKLPIVLELKSTCDFEAQIEWVVGAASPNRYRVLELKSPTRLAVDIKHQAIKN